MLKRGVTLLLAFTLLLCTTTTDFVSLAYGQGNEYSTELYRLYSMYEAKNLVEVNETYQQAFQRYLDVNKAVQVAENFNSVREEAVKFQEERKKQISLEVMEIQARNKEISEEISAYLYGELDYLKQLDAEYKTNIELINKKLSELDGFYVINAMDVPLADMDEATKAYEEAKEEYDEAVDEPASLLGEVTNVKHMVDDIYVINSNFGTRINPVSGKGAQFHGATDYRAKYGTPILAAFNGTVIAAESNWALGNYIKIDHGEGIITLYGHLDSFNVSVGEKVTQYQQIALSGNSGALTTGPHLHFALYLKGVCVDPAVLYRHLEA